MVSRCAGTDNNGYWIRSLYAQEGLATGNQSSGFNASRVRANVAGDNGCAHFSRGATAMSAGMSGAAIY